MNLSGKGKQNSHEWKEVLEWGDEVERGRRNRVVEKNTEKDS